MAAHSSGNHFSWWRGDAALEAPSGRTHGWAPWCSGRAADVAERAAVTWRRAQAWFVQPEEQEELPFIRRLRHQVVCISPLIAVNVACVSGVVAVDLGSPIFFVYVLCMLLLSCALAVSIAAPLRSPLFGVPLPATAPMAAFVSIQLIHTGLLAQHTLIDPAKEHSISIHVNQFYMFTACNLGVLWGTLPCPDAQRWGFLYALATCACSEAFRHAHLLGGSPVLWLLRGPVCLVACGVATHGIALAAVRHSLERERAMGELRMALDQAGNLPVTQLFDSDAIARSWAAGPMVKINVWTQVVGSSIVLCDFASRQKKVGLEHIATAALLQLLFMWPALLPRNRGRRYAAVSNNVCLMMPIMLAARVAKSGHDILCFPAVSTLVLAGAAAGGDPPVTIPVGSPPPVLGGVADFYLDLSPRDIAFSAQPLVDLLHGFCVSTLPLAHRPRRLILGLLMLSATLREARREMLRWSGEFTLTAVTQLLQGPVITLLAIAIVRGLQ
jgi:hypothetical protein